MTPDLNYELLELRCGVQSTARLRLGSNVAVDAESTLKSIAGLRLCAQSEINLTPRIESVADVHDVVLEMLLYSA